MTAKIVEVIIMEAVAALLFGFAYAIGVKRQMHLIAGYNDRTAHQVHDKDGLARLIARLCLLVGIASALMPAATHFWGQSATGQSAWIGAYGGFLAGILTLTMLQARDFAAPQRRLSEKKTGDT